MKVYIILILLSVQPLVHGQAVNPAMAIPGEWSPWDKNMIKFRIKWLTAEIAKDLTQKLKLADKYVEMHKENINFELGTIAAGVQEKFRYMIELYMTYSKAEDLTATKWTLDDINTVQSLLLGLYAEILQDRKLFHLLLGRHEDKKSRTASVVTYAMRRHASTTKGALQKKEEEYKKQLRKKKIEEKRGNFVPEVEGIDVDLTDVVKK